MNHIDVMKQALEALEEIALAGMSGSGQESEEGMRDWHARQAWKFIGIAARALDHLREALAAPGNQLADINVADMAAPNSVEFDGIETQPAHRGPVATFDEVFDAIDWDVWRMQPIRELVRMIHGKTAPQPATQQAPDALHLAAMDLARKQAQRIAELEQQLAAREPLTDERIDTAIRKEMGAWLEDDEDLVLYRQIARAVEAAHGIQKVGAA